MVDQEGVGVIGGLLFRRSVLMREMDLRARAQDEAELECQDIERQLHLYGFTDFWEQDAQEAAAVAGAKEGS